MANVSLKTDFKDGEKLFAQQLNNNFATIAAALAAMNKISWQDDTDESLLYFKGTTEELAERDIIEGQLLYDYTRGEHFIDHNGVRVDVVSGTVLDVVVNTLDGSYTGKAPSVNAVNQKFSDIEEDISTINNNISNLQTTVNGKLDSSKISYGTSNPSGGSNGDIYFKYS